MQAQQRLRQLFFRVIDEMYDTEEIDIKVRGKAMMISLNEELDPINNNLLSEAQDKRLREIAAQWKTANTQTILRGVLEPILASGGTVIAGLLCLKVATVCRGII